jgi:CubicO group peptidase (beta-lactamase class C family)
MTKPLALLVLLPFCVVSAQAPSYARERARIDSMMSAEVASTPIGGIAIAVIKGRDTVAMKAWGYADLENDVAATPQHIFEIGSITKQFTSAAIMQFVEKGRLSLDDTLGALLPNMPVAWRTVTLRQLLNHTSGIPSYTDIGPRWQRRWRDDMVPDSLVALTAGDTMTFAPGTRYRYNNTGYVLLGMILDKLTGQPYPKYVETQFFKPLGLASTSYCFPQTLIKRRARGYDRQGRTYRNAEYLSMTQPYSAGALCSTVGDLVAWTRALHGGKVVSAASFKAMTSPTGAAAASRYGFGLSHDTSLAGHPRIAHGGGIHGFISSLAHYPSDSLTVVVLINTPPAPIGIIAQNLARIMFGLPLEGAQMPRVTLTATERPQYVGSYALALPNGTTMVLNVTADSSGLFAQAEGPGQGKFELVPYGNHTFGAEFDRSLRITFVVEGGRATRVRLRQAGSELEGVRR